MKKNNKKIVIVAARFNEYITQSLLKACLSELKKNGVDEKNITVVWVPGSFEIPITALKAAKKKNVDAVICLGAIIRGETLHFELICHAASHGIMQAALLSGKPVIFGILSTDTIDQAERRSREKGDNKGRDAAIAALEMIDCLLEMN